MATILKWRETVIDPHKIKFKNNLILEQVLSYPHAGNDVFECVGKLNNQEKKFFLKTQRNEKSNISNESMILPLLEKHNLPIPTILDSGMINDMAYVVTNALEGDKLSIILENFDSKQFESIKYMKEYGRMLAYIHSLKIRCPQAKQRKINDIPDTEKLNEFPELKKIFLWLENNKPKFNYDTFIHGDFHYANILWKDYKITAILDWEYSGLGFKEQDIAWALILRPSQKFLNTIIEIKEFLKGYKELGKYDKNKLVWCLINGYTHFFLINKNKDLEYSKMLLDKINYLMVFSNEI